MSVDESLPTPLVRLPKKLPDALFPNPTSPRHLLRGCDKLSRNGKSRWVSANLHFRAKSDPIIRIVSANCRVRAPTPNQFKWLVEPVRASQPIADKFPSSQSVIICNGRLSRGDSRAVLPNDARSRVGSVQSQVGVLVLGCSPLIGVFRPRKLHLLYSGRFRRRYWTWLPEPVPLQFLRVS